MPQQDAVTARIAERVRELRKAAGMTGADLVASLNERGIPWKRPTLVNLEVGNRESVTVSELLALAHVFHVPINNLLLPEECGKCHDTPPPGFTCNHCRRSQA